MPGYIIHIAVAKEYIKKHKLEIKNEKNFIKGAIDPDLIVKIKNNVTKNQTHYGIWGNGNIEINFEKFLSDKKVDLKEDYWKGYLLHLLTDYCFYHIYFKQETEEVRNSSNVYQFHEDYDCLNKDLIDKYKITPMQEIKNDMNFIEKEPKYLKKEKIINFIEKISNIELEKNLKEILTQN